MIAPPPHHQGMNMYERGVGGAQVSVVMKRVSEWGIVGNWVQDKRWAIAHQGLVQGCLTEGRI